MTETVMEVKAATKNDQWRERLAAQERSGVSVRQFCKEQGLTECSFYAWRKRLRAQGPVRFALVERGPARPEPATEASLELVLVPSGNRTICRAAVGDNKPTRSSSFAFRPSRSINAKRRHTQLLWRPNSSATSTWLIPSSRTSAWTIQAVS